MLSAQDLPRTSLSDYLEGHMGQAIEMERMARAERYGYVSQGMGAIWALNPNLNPNGSGTWLGVWVWVP